MILDNDALPGIHGFNNLRSVGWSFNINGNESLNCLWGFYNYFKTNSPYTGGGTLDISDNGPGLPNPTTIQYILDAYVGDCNGDHEVDAADYIIFKSNFGQATAAGLADGDFDVDGTVEWDDLQLLIGALRDDSGGQSSTIPEPATLCLLAFGALTALHRRRK